MAATAVAAVFTGTLTTAGLAQANTEFRHVTHVWMDLGDGPSGEERIQYSTFLASLRAAVESPAGGETQDANAGLVQASLSALDGQGNRHTVDLWINPSNLYLVGFSNENHVTWQFNDVRSNDGHDMDLNRRITQTTVPYRPQTSGPVRDLSFGSNYNSMSGAAGRDRSAMGIGFNDIRASIVQLATVQNPFGAGQRDTARSLMLMVQMLSEAARFNDIEGVFRSAMSTWDVQRLSFTHQRLENSWDPISEYAHDLQAGRNPRALNIPEVGTINGMNSVRRYVRLLLADTKAANGDWNHDEL
ncbi:ribosome-inactivating family protein [Streptomyces sp. NPDC023838]|uniref:ribosome-inactivating family protein n=1 Tax=Streptomyces sp. NPDC023838 TaxID=3154325 RepID=UPI0034044870